MFWQFMDLIKRKRIYSDTAAYIYLVSWRVESLNDDNLDDLIDKFVVRHERELEVLKEVLGRISRYVRIYSDGEVELSSGNMTVKDKVFMTVLARYLAAKINELKGEEIVKNVSQDTRLDEIARIIGKTPKQVSARLSDLEKEGFIRKIGKGQYTVSSLNKALEYLIKLEKGMKKSD